MSRTPSRRPRSLVALLTGLAVVLGVVVLPSATARAVRAETAALTISLNRDFGVYFDSLGPAIPEDTFTVRGTLLVDGVAAPERPVTLYRRLKTSTGDFVPVAQDVTREGGAYYFGQQVVGTADYRVSYEPDDGTGLRTDSPTRRLDGVRDFNATKRRVDGKVFFRGVVRPGWGGRTVTLAKKRCGTCAWRVVASRTAGSTGAWSFRVYYPPKVGPVWRWQAVLARAGDFERSYSAVLTTRREYTRERSARVR